MSVLNRLHLAGSRRRGGPALPLFLEFDAAQLPAPASRCAHFPALRRVSRRSPSEDAGTWPRPSPGRRGRSSTVAHPAPPAVRATGAIHGHRGGRLAAANALWLRAGQPDGDPRVGTAPGPVLQPPRRPHARDPPTWLNSPRPPPGGRARASTRPPVIPLHNRGGLLILNWKCYDADSAMDLATEVRECYIPGFSNWKDMTHSGARSADCYVT